MFKILLFDLNGFEWTHFNKFPYIQVETTHFIKFILVGLADIIYLFYGCYGSKNIFLDLYVYTWLDIFLNTLLIK